LTGGWLYEYFIIDMKPTTIHLCMGSSCYARGNARNAEIVQAWIAEHPEACMEISGRLCEGRCKEGPIMRVGDRVFTGVSPESVEAILANFAAAGSTGAAAVGGAGPDGSADKAGRL
jgi:NADH:ubiquinone oxidoreductase subunit E